MGGKTLMALRLAGKELLRVDVALDQRTAFHDAFLDDRIFADIHLYAAELSSCSRAEQQTGRGVFGFVQRKNVELIGLNDAVDLVTQGLQGLLIIQRRGQ